MNVDEFAASLLALRRERRTTRAALAGRIGVRVETLRAWEVGESVPRDANLSAWAAALDVMPPPGLRGWNWEPAGCGTKGGYQRHWRAGEQACPECLDAHAVDVATWRAQQVTA